MQLLSLGVCTLCVCGGNSGRQAEAGKVSIRRGTTPVSFDQLKPSFIINNAQSTLPFIRCVYDKHFKTHFNENCDLGVFVILICSCSFFRMLGGLFKYN